MRWILLKQHFPPSKSNLSISTKILVLKNIFLYLDDKSQWKRQKVNHFWEITLNNPIFVLNKCIGIKKLYRKKNHKDKACFLVKSFPLKMIPTIFLFFSISKWLTKVFLDKYSPNVLETKCGQLNLHYIDVMLQLTQKAGIF